MNDKEGIVNSDVGNYCNNPLDDVLTPYSDSDKVHQINIRNSLDEHPNGNAILSIENIEHSRQNQLPKYCFTCRTRAKMGNNLNHSKSNGIKTITCDNKGCIGYIGHAPIQRIQKTYSTETELFDSAMLSDGETSDDVPLLITDINKMDRNRVDRCDSDNVSGIIRSLSEEELSVVDHCHASALNDSLSKRNATKKAKRQLITACVLCCIFIAGEVVGGKISNSLAIMSDAAHMTSDFATFCVSLFSIWMGEKAARKSYTFGFHRAEAIGALFTIMIIWFVTGILFYLACSRLSSGDFTVEPDSMMVVAGCAVVFNIVLGVLLHGAPHGHTHGSNGGHSHSKGDMNHNHSHVGETNKRSAQQREKERHLNVRAALIHVLGDLIQSVGVLISSIIIKFFPSAKNADPVCTIIFSIIVMCTTTQVLRDVVRILMEGHPKGYAYDEIRSALMGIDNVIAVHDLRVWSLTNDHIVLTAHLAVNPQELAENERILQVCNIELYFNTLVVRHHLLKSIIQ